MIFLWYVLIGIGSSLLGAMLDSYLASRQRGPDAQPFVPPIVAPGTGIALGVGTYRFRPNWVYMGPVTTEDIKSQTGSEFFGLIPIIQTTGKRYKVTAMGILCYGMVGDLQNVIFDPNKPLTDEPLTTPQVTNFQITNGIFGGVGSVNVTVVNQPRVSGWVDTFTRILHGGRELLTFYLPAIFGGEAQGGGGGFTGRVYFYVGGGQNGPNEVIESLVGAGNLPSYRELVFIVYDGVNVGTRPTMPPVDWIFDVTPTIGPVSGLGAFGGTTNVRTIISRSALVMVTGGGGHTWTAKDVSPLYAAYVLMTHRLGGLGRSPDEWDLNRLNDAAQQTLSEGIGVSFSLFGSRAAAKEKLAEMWQIAGGVPRRDPQSNKLEIKLVRAEDVSTMREFTGSQIIDADLTRRELPDTFNEVTVFFSNADKLYEEDFVTVRDRGNVAATGTIRPLQSIRLMSITYRPQAIAQAIRELKAASVPAHTGTVTLTRSGWDVERGDVCKYDIPWLGFTTGDYGKIILRAIAVNLGGPKSNVVKVTVTEDLFAFENPFVEEVDTPTVVPIGSGPTKRAPTIVPTQRQTVSQGFLDLVIVDPDNTISLIEGSESAGGAAATAFHALTETLNVATDAVAIITDGTSSIAWRVTYNLGNGDQQVNGTVDFAPPGVTEQTLDGTVNPIIWDVTGRANDSASVVINGNRTLAIVGAVAGFRGKILITSTNATGNVLTLPLGSIIDGGGTTVTLGLKDQLSVHYDGTYFWWGHDTSSNTVPAVPLAASISSTLEASGTLADLRGAMDASGSPLGDLST